MILDYKKLKDYDQMLHCNAIYIKHGCVSLCLQKSELHVILHPFFIFYFLHFQALLYGENHIMFVT